MSIVVRFDQAASGSLVGGKGANLITLTRAGFPVPGGFVVTAEAYDQFLAGATWLNAAIAELDYDHPDKLREQCDAIRRKLKTAELPKAVQDATLEAIAKVGAGGAFAVRSSSTFEDLAQAAFAGQHDTYLNVRGGQQILDRLRDCFASLWEDRAVHYRHRNGFNQRDARMAVVVQQQVTCDAAGVGFSIDPISGRMDRMMIDAAFGLGETVVSGEGETDHFELDKSNRQITHQVIGHKEHQLVAAGDHVEKRAVVKEQVDQPCLNQDQIHAVAQLLLEVEAHYGWPQDIEWGFADSRLHLLQSRPVTTMQPDWTRDESAERFPNPMTPLSWDFIREAFDVSLHHSLALMGLPSLKGDWFHIFDHYIYGNQNAVRLIAMFRPMRARSIAELQAELPELRRRFAWVMDLPVHWARDLDRYLIRLGELRVRRGPKTLQEAWNFVSDVLGAAQDYFRPNIAISMTQSGLYRLLHHLIAMVSGPEQALAIVDGLLAGCETKTTIVNREIHELAALATKTPALSAELIDRGGSAFIEGKQLAAYPAFAERFERFISDHGHREVDIDYRVPTWSGQPGVVLDSVTLLLKSPAAEDPADTLRAQRIRQIQAEQQFISAVPEGLQFFFRELIRLTRTYTMLDDLEHYQTTRVNPLARQGAMWLGQSLVGLGALTAADDVFFLNKTDIKAIVADTSPAAIRQLREKSRSQKASYEQAARQAPAWSYGKAPVVSEESSANVLKGLPGSAGVATGKAFRVHGPEDFGKFPAGAVLVARTTNPAWTPLFYAACAVVTESGGPLSHGAVTAREMGLPAVMSVRDIMTRVTDGQQLTVDGTNGTVNLGSP